MISWQTPCQHREPKRQYKVCHGFVGGVYASRCIKLIYVWSWTKNIWSYFFIKLKKVPAHWLQRNEEAAVLLHWTQLTYDDADYWAQDHAPVSGREKLKRKYTRVTARTPYPLVSQSQHQHPNLQQHAHVLMCGHGRLSLCPSSAVMS